MSHILAGIQTPEQLKLFKQYASRGLCVDSTHNMTRYDLKLSTVLVYDEYGMGRPIALFFAKEEKEEYLRHLFEHLKQR
jgi:hypothetical protein